MAAKNKKISLNYIIDSLNEVSGANHNDFMSDSASHVECVQKAFKFLKSFDLLNTSKIDFEQKATENEVV